MALHCSSRTNLSSQQAAYIADVERVWQVRRFCQARPIAVGVRSDRVPRDVSGGDAALAALLTCLLHELGADLAAISLLDERNQYFLSVVHAATIHDPTIRRADWFGCEQIPIAGGICEKTISRDYAPGESPVYEILDLLSDESTRSLPVVDGTVASFRYYAGAPISTVDGLNVGALFIFKKASPPRPLSAPQRRFMCATAGSTMRHIAQTIGALDNTRSVRCNSLASSFLNLDFLNEAPDPGQDPGAAETPDLNASRVYQGAAGLLSDAFDLEGVIIQRLPRSITSVRTVSPDTETFLAEHYSARNGMQGTIGATLAQKLLDLFPTGGILQLASSAGGGCFIGSDPHEPSSRKNIRLEFCEQFPNIQQAIFMPLRDSFHDRDAAFLFGWTSDFKRVFSHSTDIPSMSSFATAITNQVRRLETQELSRKKSDFLGSISHEMLSPLHGIVACIELLQSSGCSAQQLDLLADAKVCGQQLKDNIDHVLAFSKIGLPSRRTVDVRRSSAANQSPVPIRTAHEQHMTSNGDSLLDLVEGIVCQTARVKQPVKSPLATADAPMQSTDQSTTGTLGRPVQQTIVTVDATVETDLGTTCASDVRVIVRSLLDNCLKFTPTGGCIRVSLESQGEMLRLSFADTGRGMLPDFVRNGLLEPFSQQDPLDCGVGLGLMLVQDAVRRLKGEMTVETDESSGTDISVLLPREQLTFPGHQPRTGTIDMSLAAKDPSRLSLLAVRLFAPVRWRQSQDARQKHCLSIFSRSIASTFQSWLDVELRVWEPSEGLPQVLVMLYSDTQSLDEVAGGESGEIWKIILCPDHQAQAHLATMVLGSFVTIVGPLTPSKLCTAVSSLPWSGHGRQDSNTLERDTAGQPNGHSAAQINGDQDKTQSAASVMIREDTPERIMSPDTPKVETRPLGSNTVESRARPRDPRFLLVDDNAINLKVVGMYAKKCSHEPSVLAGTGQQAIDAYRATRPGGGTRVAPPAFDIVLLDLSMPEVSGFDVAAAIRETERAAADGSRVYIAALTGLVSDKDREAAFAAGVDEYVTKPALLRDIRGVVSNWRNAWGVL